MNQFNIENDATTRADRATLTTDVVSHRPARSEQFPWYDSNWLQSYTNARQLIAVVAPKKLADFERAMQVFHTDPAFQVKQLDAVFDAQTLDEIRQIVKSLKPTELELHEAHNFKRFVVHNQSRLTQLQHQLVDLVSAAAGEPVEVSYNFLSLYSSRGVCPMHMDAPQAKWTVDLCLNQNVEWPIYFSPILPWSELEGLEWSDGWEERVRQSASWSFQSHVIQPGQAILFSGSSQWHYRDPMPATTQRPFCDLLFFHFIPRGTAELIEPRNWAQLFDIPELTVD
jgi:hypothetical protein